MFHKPRRVLPRILSFLAVSICVLVICAFFAAMIIEWMAGCGESYVDSKGERHRYECVFLTIHNEGVKQ